MIPFELNLTSGSTAVVYGYSYYNTTKGALTELNISNNKLTQGAYNMSTYTYDTDMTGTWSFELIGA